MSSMTMASPAMTAMMVAAMMVAMMLPSIAPAVWRYHRHLHAMGTPRAGERTMLFSVGYAGVWTVIGVALFAMSAALSPTSMSSPATPPFAPWVTGAVVLCAGVVQRSGWKANHLLRCGPGCVMALTVSGNLMAAWRDGCRLGVDCALSCTPPMAILFVAGLMDPRMMTVITAAIAAERVAPAGPRIARLSGGLALVSGVIMCARL